LPNICGEEEAFLVEANLRVISGEVLPGSHVITDVVVAMASRLFR
jgi:hypothetical protein